MTTFQIYIKKNLHFLNCVQSLESFCSKYYPRIASSQRILVGRTNVVLHLLGRTIVSCSIPGNGHTYLHRFNVPEYSSASNKRFLVPSRQEANYCILPVNTARHRKLDAKKTVCGCLAAASGNSSIMRIEPFVICFRALASQFGGQSSQFLRIICQEEPPLSSENILHQQATNAYAVAKTQIKEAAQRWFLDLCLEVVLSDKNAFR